jgi:DNA-binding response OmpR family regulator
MLTADDTSETLGAALDLGVSEFLTKPFSTRTLRDAVAKHIKRI